MTQGMARRPSPALVISCLALFVALSTGSYAAIKANSIGAKQIKANAVRTAELKDGGVGASDLGDNSVGAAEVQNGAVGGGEVGDGTITGDDVQDGSLGSGDVGDESLTGGDVQNGSLGSDDLGTDSVNGQNVLDGSLTRGDLAANSVLPGQIIARRTDFALPAGPSAGNPGAEVDGFETCEPGETIIGGAVNTSSPAGATTLISRPATDTVGNGGIPLDNAFTAWKGTARTETNVAATMRVFALCAR